MTMKNRNSGFVRDKDDWYVEPAWVLNALLEHVDEKRHLTRARSPR
jgi:hypothetical protein